MDHLFPALPEKISLAAPIMVSPISGSFERVCIGAVSVIGDGVEVSVIGLPESIAKMSYQITLVAKQLKDYLEAGNEIDNFEPMISDFYVGPVEYGRFGSHEIAIRAILRNNSFLYGGA